MFNSFWLHERPVFLQCHFLSNSPSISEDCATDVNATTAEQQSTHADIPGNALT